MFFHENKLAVQSWNIYSKQLLKGFSMVHKFLFLEQYRYSKKIPSWEKKNIATIDPEFKNFDPKYILEL
jgi:hypothetical protein